MFVITIIFFPELFAPFWLILTPIRKGSIVFKGLLHLHYILRGSHSKAIKNQKKNIQFSVLRSSFHYMLHKWAVKQVFFPHWWSLSFQSEYLSTFFPLSSYESKGAHCLPGFIWWQNSHKKITFFLLIMTSNLSRGKSDLHNFSFFPSISLFQHCHMQGLLFLEILSGHIKQITPIWFFFLHMETPEKIWHTVAFSKRLNQLWNKQVIL